MSIVRLSSSLGPPGLGRLGSPSTTGKCLVNFTLRAVLAALAALRTETVQDRSMG